MTFISSSSKESQEYGQGEPKKKESTTSLIKQTASKAATGATGLFGETVGAISSLGKKRGKVVGGGKGRRTSSKLARTPLSMSPLMDFDLDPTRQTSITDISGGILAPFDMSMDLGIDEMEESHSSLTNVKGGLLSKNERFKLF